MPDFTVIGIGRIATADDVIEFLLAGANGVQMLSAALLKGKNLYSKVIENLPIALEKYGFRSIQEVVDTSLSRSISYEPFVPTVDNDSCVKCMLCEKICPYFAITIDEYPILNKRKCFGCHLCVSKCPTKSIAVE